MKKLNPDNPQTHSADVVADNVERLRELFPEAFTEGRIDFDVLKQLLSGVLEERDEKYGLNWHGKRRARQLALTPSTGTLRPCHEESVDWDTTKNLMIEGDNLEVLKLLQKSYAGKVKLVYIDQPYNTGKDFVYPDDFRNNIQNYLELTGQVNGEDGRVSSNTEASGRFHTDWLNMLYPRLKLARQLLCDHGFLFVSIDVEEVANLRLLCNELFGEECFIGLVSRATGTRMGSGSRGIARELDYLLVYSKSANAALQRLPMTPKELALYDQEDERGRYLTRSLRRTGGENRREDRPSMFYAVQAPSGEKVYPIAPEGWESRWVCGKDTYAQLLRDGFIEWKQVTKDGTTAWKVYQKHYLKDSGKESSDLWSGEEGNKKATRDLNAIFDGRKVFDHPKPVGVMRKLLQLATQANNDDIVLDFFAGSGTTGQAVVEQNTDDGGTRRFILVQLPEQCPDSSDAARAELLTIADICKSRLQRVGTSRRASHPMFGGDVGFRVFKLDHSNIRAWDPSPEDLEAALFDGVEHLRDGRSEQDVLYELLLKLGLDLCVPIEDRAIAGKTVHSIGAGTLFVCLPKKVTADEAEELALGIAGWREELKTAGDTTVVFRDSAFADDVAKTNASAILEQHGIENVRSL